MASIMRPCSRCGRLMDTARPCGHCAVNQTVQIPAPAPVPRTRPAKPADSEHKRLLKALIFSAHVIILLLLMVLNPGPEEFTGWMRDTIAAQSTTQEEAMLSGLSALKVVSQTRRHNYGLFSVYEIFDDSGRSRAGVLGICRTFVPISARR
jgi:hypothetical protein